ncbi:hypothetical protein D915_009941 [Fasciola hepatica]|uniref:Uncharacterized protein n=1 Tax=Fasciola hepatica TaxID=6192 RepID=A0A4E0QV94_FASHE|nr:hypothetical protein D915_009941 [Fasciola hepatica]
MTVDVVSVIYEWSLLFLIHLAVFFPMVAYGFTVSH